MLKETIIRLISPKEELKEEIIDISFIQERGIPSHCDCEKIKSGRGCSPDCFIFCSLSNAFEEAQAYIDSQCTKTIPPFVIQKLTSLANLKDIYTKAQQKITKLKAEKLPEIKGCEHCHEVSTITNLTQPYIFEQDTCDKTYIKTHNFSKRIKFQKKKQQSRNRIQRKNKDTSCTEEKLDQLTKTLQDYVTQLLKDNEELNDNCPDQCSFYTNSIITLEKDNCIGQIDLYVNCNHKKIGIFGDYIVNISYQKQKQCTEKS